jgi:hypothetical protein
LSVIPWWIWVVPAAGLMVVLMFRLLRPAVQRGVTLTSVKPLLESFVLGSRHQSMLVLEREGDTGLLQLQLSSETGSTRVVEFGLPYVDWSAEKFDSVAEALIEAGYSLQVESAGSCNAVRRFLRVAASGPAHLLAADGWKMLSIAQDSLGWRDDTTFTVHIEDPLGLQVTRFMRRTIRTSR